MRKLATNTNAALFLCGKEYWIVVKGWETSALNYRSDQYNASNAIAYFKKHYGEPTWVNDDINCL